MSDTRKHADPRCSRTLRATAALLMGTVLVGCAAPGTGPGLSRYEPTYLRLTEERAFAAALRRHYLELATNAFDRGDVERSDFYSLRALMAAEGKLAHPGQPARHVDVGGEAAAVGQRLSALMMTGVRMGAPDLAARAQAAFDCWLVESGPSGDPQIAQSCRYNAMNTLALLEGASTGAQLQTAGGPTVPQGQTYVIENGAPSRTINAPAGFTIEVETTHGGGGYVPDHFVQERLPATYTTAIPQAAPSYVVESAPMMSEPAYIETAPMVEQQPIQYETIPMTTYADHSGFDATPVISAAHAQMYATEPMVATEPMYATEAAPMMMEEVGAPMNIIPETMQMTMIEAPSIDLGAVETVPVFGTAPVESMPMVEMAPMAMSYQGDAASALIDATANMQSDFAVFFGFDSDEVTLEAEDVLISTIERIKLNGATRVMLMGFTDSVGDARYNQLLAMRRAQSIRQFLQQSLGNSVSFEILPVGEVQAVQNGGDGVKEALNRKVEISIQ